MLSATLRTYQKVACDSEEVVIACPRGTSISIEFAQYNKFVQKGMQHLPQYFWFFNSMHMFLIQMATVSRIYVPCLGNWVQKFVVKQSTYFEDPFLVYPRQKKLLNALRIVDTSISKHLVTKPSLPHVQVQRTTGLVQSPVLEMFKVLTGTTKTR